MLFRQLFDQESSTYTYLIADEETKEALLVDTVLEKGEREVKLLEELGLTLRYTLETHIHADHITGASYLKAKTNCINIVPDGAKASCADHFMQHNESLNLGSVQIKGIATPGHTDVDLTYLVNQTHLLTGDALFIRGCGRTDFQNGDAGKLFDSVTEHLFTLPDHTLVYPAHDYQGRTVSSIGEEKQYNPRFFGRTRQQFIELMNSLKLPNPRKIMEAVPANEQCGKILQQTVNSNQ
ncbi:MAG: MBL fold metallo-hydrolase [Microcystaceae cyanobacterium]